MAHCGLVFVLEMSLTIKARKSVISQQSARETQGYWPRTRNEHFLKRGKNRVLLDLTSSTKSGKGDRLTQPPIVFVLVSAAATMTDSREDNVYTAKLAEQAERYDGELKTSYLSFGGVPWL